MKIGDRIYVRGYIDEIRKDTVIVRNDGGYFGTVLSEVTGELSSAQPEPCEDAVSRKAVQYLLAHFVNEDKYNDACDGLKHLPSVTPKQAEPCENCISRQAAIEAIFELHEYQRDIDPTEAADLVRQGIFLAEKKIEQLPSAQPELRRGEES